MCERYHLSAISGQLEIRMKHGIQTWLIASSFSTPATLRQMTFQRTRFMNNGTHEDFAS